MKTKLIAINNNLHIMNVQVPQHFAPKIARAKSVKTAMGFLRTSLSHTKQYK
jgi:hypothetical protein